MAFYEGGEGRRKGCAVNGAAQPLGFPERQINVEEF